MATGEDRDKRLDRVKRNLRSTIQSNGKEGLSLRFLEREYIDFHDHPIPYKSFGYNNLLEFLKSSELRDACRLQPDYSNQTPNQYLLFIVADEKVAHMQELGNKANSKKKKKKIKMRYPNNPPNMYGNYSNFVNRSGTSGMVGLARTTGGSTRRPSGTRPSYAPAAVKSNGLNNNSFDPAIKKPTTNKTTRVGWEVYGSYVISIMEPRPYGINNKELEKEYVKKFKENLPADWLEQLENRILFVTNRFRDGLIQLMLLPTGERVKPGAKEPEPLPNSVSHRPEESYSEEEYDDYSSQEGSTSPDQGGSGQGSSPDSGCFATTGTTPVGAPVSKFPAFSSETGGAVPKPAQRIPTPLQTIPTQNEPRVSPRAAMRGGRLPGNSNYSSPANISGRPIEPRMSLVTKNLAAIDINTQQQSKNFQPFMENPVMNPQLPNQHYQQSFKGFPGIYPRIPHHQNQQQPQVPSPLPNQRVPAAPPQQVRVPQGPPPTLQLMKPAPTCPAPRVPQPGHVVRHLLAPAVPSPVVPRVENDNDSDWSDSSGSLFSDTEVDTVKEMKEAITISGGGRDDTTDCAMCNRPMTVVFCIGCCEYEYGTRMRKLCPKHPFEIRAQDLTACPKCRRSDHLHELKQSEENM